MVTLGRVVFNLLAAVLVFLAVPTLMAQKTDIQLSGRIDSSINMFSPDQSEAVPAWSALGLAYGRVGLVGGSQLVKAELRGNFSTYSLDSPSFGLDRAWIKFRFPGLRTTLGLGHLSWGPGYVFNVGDLLSDSTSLAVNLGADELRSQSAWLGDVWIALGDESFVEAMVLTPPTTLKTIKGTTNLFPNSIDQMAGGMRLSVAPTGWLFELAYAADGSSLLHKISVSTQFHAGLDWYAGIRADLPFNGSPSWEHGLSASVGTFGLWDLGEGFGLSTRHEALLRPWQNWSTDLSGWSTSDAPPGSAGAGRPYGLYSYHELTLTMPEQFSTSLRALYSPVDSSALAMARIDWTPLQALGLYLQASFKIGGASATYAWQDLGGFTLGLGAICSW